MMMATNPSNEHYENLEGAILKPTEDATKKISAEGDSGAVGDSSVLSKPCQGSNTIPLASNTVSEINHGSPKCMYETNNSNTRTSQQCNNLMISGQDDKAGASHVLPPGVDNSQPSLSVMKMTTNYPSNENAKKNLKAPDATKKSRHDGDGNAVSVLVKQDAGESFDYIPLRKSKTIPFSNDTSSLSEVNHKSSNELTVVTTRSQQGNNPWASRQDDKADPLQMLSPVVNSHPSLSNSDKFKNDFKICEERLALSSKINRLSLNMIKELEKQVERIYGSNSKDLQKFMEMLEELKLYQLQANEYGMPLDSEKLRCLVDWINCICVGDHIESLEQLKNGVHFIAILRKIDGCIGSLCKTPSDRFQVINNFLEEHYNISDLSVVLKFDRISKGDILELAKVTCLLLCFAVYYPLKVGFITPISGLDLSTQNYLIDIIKHIYPEGKSLNHDFAAVLYNEDGSSPVISTPLIENTSPTVLEFPESRMKSQEQVKNLKRRLHEEVALREDREAELEELKEEISNVNAQDVIEKLIAEIGRNNQRYVDEVDEHKDTKSKLHKLEGQWKRCIQKIIDINEKYEAAVAEHEEKKNAFMEENAELTSIISDREKQVKRLEDQLKEERIEKKDLQNNLNKCRQNIVVMTTTYTEELTTSVKKQQSQQEEILQLKDELDKKTSDSLNRAQGVSLERTADKCVQHLGNEMSSKKIQCSLQKREDERHKKEIVELQKKYKRELMQEKTANEHLAVKHTEMEKERDSYKKKMEEESQQFNEKAKELQKVTEEKNLLLSREQHKAQNLQKVNKTLCENAEQNQYSMQKLEHENAQLKEEMNEMRKKCKEHQKNSEERHKEIVEIHERELMQEKTANEQLVVKHTEMEKERDSYKKKMEEESQQFNEKAKELQKVTEERTLLLSREQHKAQNLQKVNKTLCENAEQNQYSMQKLEHENAQLKEEMNEMRKKCKEHQKNSEERHKEIVEIHERELMQEKTANEQLVVKHTEMEKERDSYKKKMEEESQQFNEKAKELQKVTEERTLLLSREQHKAQNLQKVNKTLCENAEQNQYSMQKLEHENAQLKEEMNEMRKKCKEHQKNSEERHKEIVEIHERELMQEKTANEQLVVKHTEMEKEHDSYKKKMEEIAHQLKANVEELQKDLTKKSDLETQVYEKLHEVKKEREKDKADLTTDENKSLHADLQKMQTENQDLTNQVKGLTEEVKLATIHSDKVEKYNEDLLAWNASLAADLKKKQLITDSQQPSYTDYELLQTKAKLETANSDKVFLTIERDEEKILTKNLKENFERKTSEWKQKEAGLIKENEERTLALLMEKHKNQNLQEEMKTICANAEKNQCSMQKREDELKHENAELKQENAELKRSPPRRGCKRKSDSIDDIENLTKRQRTN